MAEEAEKFFAVRGQEAMKRMLEMRNPTWPIHADYVAYGLPNCSNTSLVVDKDVVEDCCTHRDLFSTFFSRSVHQFNFSIRFVSAIDAFWGENENRSF